MSSIWGRFYGIANVYGAGWRGHLVHRRGEPCPRRKVTQVDSRVGVAPFSFRKYWGAKSLLGGEHEKRNASKNNCLCPLVSATGTLRLPSSCSAAAAQRTFNVSTSFRVFNPPRFRHNDASQVQASNPLEEDVVSISTVLRQAVSVEISLSNPLNEPIRFQVSLQVLCGTRQENTADLVLLTYNINRLIALESKCAISDENNFGVRVRFLGR